jgi:hypothetical protein
MMQRTSTLNSFGDNLPRSRQQQRLDPFLSISLVENQLLVNQPFRFNGLMNKSFDRIKAVSVKQYGPMQDETRA